MPAQFENRVTALLAKRPEPGRVKTRLCPPLTPEQAVRLAEGMLADAVERLLAGEHRAVLAHAPAEDGAWFRERFPGVPDLRPQRGDGLGRRMANLVEDLLADGAARTLVLVGSDQPLVPRARVREAHEALERGAGCVLGPDPGGGYYLIGLARSVPELFTRVTMSSADMRAATEREARAHGLRVVTLPEHGDVDVAEDLEHLCAVLAAAAPTGHERDPDHPSHTRAALHDLGLLAP